MTKEEKAVYDKKYRLANHAARSIVKADYRQSARGRATDLLRAARYRAKRKGLNYSLTLEWLAEQLKSGECPRTGCEFDYEPMPKHHAANPYAPSIDRIDSTKGYTPENTQVVCWAYNTAKHTWSDEITIKVAQAIASMDLVKRLTQQY